MGDPRANHCSLGWNSVDLAADLDAVSASVFFHSINVAGWHRSSCTLPHQSLVANLLHKFAALQEHKMEACLYSYSQAEWLLPLHRTTKNTCEYISIMLLITNQCSMCFPQFKWNFHGAICMISQPHSFIRALCEQNSQTHFKPAGLLTKILFIVSVIVSVHHLLSGFAKHIFFLLSKNEILLKRRSCTQNSKRNDAE